MNNILLLVSGMPGTGKSTFAKWLSSELYAPLVCYDEIKRKALDIAYKVCSGIEQMNLFAHVPLDFFWFTSEVIMRSSSKIIIESFFNENSKQNLDYLVTNYKYKTINIHMDAPMEITYNRFIERSKHNQEVEGLRPKEISYNTFENGAKQYKDFRFGENIIFVETSDFSKIVYADILNRIKDYL